MSTPSSTITPEWPTQEPTTTRKAPPPGTAIQRCIFHLKRNVTCEMMRNPRLRAGKHLRQIALTLSDVHTVDDAITWRLTLETWWMTHGHLLRGRTLYDNGHFGYTHKPLRKAWAILHRVTENEHAFTFVRHRAPRSTSRLEGLNSQIRNLLRHHGACPLSANAAPPNGSCCCTKSPSTTPTNNAHNLAAPTSKDANADNNDDPTPALYDNALDASEGFWLRTGWAGRH